MTYLGINLTHRFKSLRKSSSSCTSSQNGSIDTCHSETSFASFPTDPFTKAPLQSSKKQVPCSSSWGLIVALNQSDDQPELPDDERLQEFARRSSIYNSEHEEHRTKTSTTPPAEKPCNLLDAKSAVDNPVEQDSLNQHDVDLNVELKDKNDGKDVPPITTSQKIRRLSHRASFSVLSDRYTWLKSHSGNTSTIGKHDYARIKIDEADSNA